MRTQLLVRLFWWGCIGSWLIACSQSVEEQVVVPASDSPTVLAFLCPQDSIHTVNVRYTAPAIGVSNEKKFYTDLKQSTVQLTGPGGSDRMIYDSLYRVFQLPATRFAVQAGQTYRVTVQMPGRAAVTASCTIPAKTVDPASISSTSSTSGSDGLPGYTFRWADLPNEANYYALFRVTTRYDPRYKQTSVEFEEARLTLSDQGYENGTIVAQPVSLPRRNDYGVAGYSQTDVYICHTDKNYYDYHRILAQLQRDESPFSEPGRIVSNVTNGYGIVAGYTRVRVNIK